MTSVRRERMELADTRLLLNRLRAATHSDGANPKSFALLLRKIFEERAWEKEGFPSFSAFVIAPDPIGLDMTPTKLLEAARLADVETLARSLLYEEEAEAVKPGGDRRSPQFQDGTTILKLPSRSNDAAHTVARLKRDDPDLAEKVVSGEISAYAASRAKGWKPPRIVLSTPERIAASLRKWMPRDALARLAELLAEPDDAGNPKD